MEKEKQHTMLALVHKWKQSGMSVEAYAKKVGVSKSKFGYWIRKDKKVIQHSHFIEVGTLLESQRLVKDDRPQISMSGKPQVELTFPDGLCLKIYV